MVFFLLILSYVVVVSPAFEYMGFHNDFRFHRLLISMLFVLLFIQAGSWINAGLLHTVWHIILIICLFPQLIFYTYSSGDLRASVGYMVFLFILFLFSKLRVHNLKSKVINIEQDPNQTIILAIAIALFLPFLYYLPYINIKNLWFKDIYTTRFLFREIEHFKGSTYLLLPLSRVLLPAIIVVSIQQNKKLILLLVVMLTTYLYLASGASKSIYFGIFVALFFYLGTTYKYKLQFFAITLILLIFLGILEYKIFDFSAIQFILIRRVLFIPPLMEEVYYNYFRIHEKTYYTHSILSFIGEADYGLSLSRFVGEKVIGIEGLNANVGVVPDGFLSMGWIGVIINSSIISYTFLLLDRMNINHIFFGIIFSYIFYFNSASLGTLLLTHGYAFLIIFAFFCLKNYER
ncbi:MAG: hypothetical protein KAR19_06415 [Bacteroidales bacterium]|nr:hypothetical protein [Bacteroidales bacterium]